MDFDALENDPVDVLLIYGLRRFWRSQSPEDCAEYVFSSPEDGTEYAFSSPEDGTECAFSSPEGGAEYTLTQALFDSEATLSVPIHRTEPRRKYSPSSTPAVDRQCCFGIK